jgi:hypothetical protein
MVTRSLVGRWGGAVWILSAGSLVAAACGGNSDDPPVTNTAPTAGRGGSSTHMGGSSGKSSGGKSNGGSSGQSDGGMSGDAGSGNTGTGATGGEAATDPRAPLVEITSPQAETDPDGGGVLIEAELDVVCKVTKSPERGSKDFLPSSIVMQMLDAKGNVVPNEVDGTLPTQKVDDDEYSAHFILNKVPDNGKVSFRCFASDTSNPPLSATATLTTLLDHGPKITRSEPEEASPHALEGAVHFEFSVDEAPLTRTGDSGAKIAKVELIVGGVTIDNLDENDGVYTVDVSLDDKSLFPTAPSGNTPITIRATNERKPVAVTSIESYGFVVDGEGPKITVTAPERRSVAGGLVTLAFDVVDDASGVDQDTVMVAINGDEHYYGDASGTWTNAGDHYTYEFDSRLIEDNVYQAGFTLRATDRAGNESVGESWLIYLDNVAPIVDMNPGNVRMWHESGTLIECSASFDPLGEAIGGDADNVAFVQNLGDNSALIRALVWERTNPGAGARYSKTVEDEVFVYIQPNTDEPLLTSDDDDPECDDIPKAVRDKLELIHLTVLKSQGGADFRADPGTEEPPFSGYGCSSGSADDASIHYLCQEEVSDMSATIKFDGEGHEPVVFALEPVESGFQCTGAPYELSGHVQEGWFCLAARARDEAKNIGFSRPVRVCYDDYRTPEHPACLDGKNPPSCTDGCDLPPTFPGDADDAYVLTP